MGVKDPGVAEESLDTFVEQNERLALSRIIVNYTG
jgi:hypothetical protein